MGGKVVAIPRAPKSHKYFLKRHICFRKPSGSNMGAPNLFLAPVSSEI